MPLASGVLGVLRAHGPNTGSAERKPHASFSSFPALTPSCSSVRMTESGPNRSQCRPRDPWSPALRGRCWRLPGAWLSMALMEDGGPRPAFRAPGREAWLCSGPSVSPPAPRPAAPAKARKTPFVYRTKLRFGMPPKRKKGLFNYFGNYSVFHTFPQTYTFPCSESMMLVSLCSCRIWFHLSSFVSTASTMSAGVRSIVLCWSILCTL